MDQVGNLNIREYLVAGTGVVFAEGNLTANRGMSYLESVEQEARKRAAKGDEPKVRLTRQQYAVKYGSKTNAQKLG